MININGTIINPLNVSSISEIVYGYGESQKFEIEINNSKYYFSNKMDCVKIRLDILRAMGMNNNDFTEDDLNPEFEDEDGHII